MATGGGESISDTAINPLIEIAAPHLMVEISSANDSDSLRCLGSNKGRYTSKNLL